MIASPTVILVAHDWDEHSDALEKLLRERGRVQLLRCSSQELLTTRFSVCPGEWASVHELELGDGTLAGFWRRPGTPNVDGYDARFHSFLRSESSDAFRGGLLSIPVNWLTDPTDLQYAELKLVQLASAKRVGVPSPSTLLTTDREAARDFRAKHSEVVIKPVRYGLVTDEDPPQVAWTSILTDEVLLHWDGSPVLLQKLVRAREHLRIVTVREDVWACSLVATELDWREQLENHSAFRAVDRDAYEAVFGLSRKIAEELRLGYTAQDWIIDEQGEPWFLEANPNGQWLFLDNQLEGAITSSIAQHLEGLAGSA